MPHYATQILNASYVVILFFFLIMTSSVGFSAKRSVIYRRQFEYKFDKTRWPLWRRSVFGIMGGCFIYASIITRNVGGGIAFSLLVSPFAMLACLLSICYVPLDSKRVAAPTRAKKHTKAASKNTWKLP